MREVVKGGRTNGCNLSRETGKFQAEQVKLIYVKKEKGNHVSNTKY